MLILDTSKVEPYLRSKGLKFKRRGQKAELQICPICHGGDSHDKNTFVVYLDSTGGNYKCMRGSCGATGSFWQLAEHYGDDPKEFYQSNGHYTPTFPPKKIIPKFETQPFVLQGFTETAIDYLHRRGFSDEVLDSVSIGCDESGNITFEYFHNAELCFVKVRNAGKPTEGKGKAWAKWKNGLRTLWGLEQCESEYPFVVITMGEYDRIAVRQAKVPNTVSIPSGDEDFEWVNICWDELEKFKQIIVWPDNDKSGQKCLATMAERLGKHRVRIVRVDFKDANEMLFTRTKAVGREKAEDEMFDAFEKAEWYFTSDIIEVVDIPEREQDFTGYLTGFPFLNQALHGFLKGQLTVHTGDSKHGKSTALTQLAATCIEQGAVVCAWSGEDDEYSFKYRMDVHLAGYLGTEFRMSNAGREYAKIKPEYRALIDDFIRGRLFLFNKRFGITEDNLAESFELAHKRYGCDVFLVDNLMKMVASKDTQQVYFRQAQVINRLSDFAKDLGCHVHIATHVNKAGAENEPPKKNTVSGAKEITNLADIVLSWWRIPEKIKDQFENGDTLCSVLANRVFGDEPAQALQYDWRVKRFGQNVNDLAKIYIGDGYDKNLAA